MKPKHHSISIVVLSLFILIATSGRAQVQELIPEDSTYQQTTEITPGDNEERPIKVNYFEKDSAATRILPVKAKLNSESIKSEKIKEDADEEESILSFNFIYYIIKKFKLSDIIDH